jgi:nucleoside-diphosphate-sugar epimerase
MNETVFLTGGAGRIGQRVLNRLLKRGYRVKALVHNHKPEGVDNERLELIKGDLLNQEGLKEAVKGCSFICHLAAVFDMFGPPKYEKENNMIFENIVRGTYNILEAARTIENLKLFLYASTDAVYATGPRKFEAPITEETELISGRFYALTKIVGETMCIQYGNLYNMPWIIIRIDWSLASDEVLNIFKYEFWADDIVPEDKKRLESKLANGKGVFAPLFENGESAVEHITDSEDTAEGIVLAIEKYETAQNNIFNIAGPEPFRYLDVIQKIAACLGVVWDSGKVLGIKPYEVSNEKAKKILGYLPKYSITKMIEKALAQQ